MSGSGSTQPGEVFEFSVMGGSGPFDIANAASGVMTWSGPTPQGGFMSMTADAYCLLVDGDRARMRGNVTASSTHPEIVGRQIQFYIEDNGPYGAGLDRFAGPLTPTTQDFGCPLILAPLGGALLTAGDVVVERARGCKQHKTDPDKDKCKSEGKP